MSPKARATGGETLDSPLRIEYSDDEHSKRKSFRQVLKHPKKLFRERKPAKNTSVASKPSPNLAERTRVFPAIALEIDTSTPPHDGLGKKSPGHATQGGDESSEENQSSEEPVGISSANSQKRKQSQDHIDGTARSTSKSRKEQSDDPKDSQSSQKPTKVLPFISADNPLQAWFEANRDNPYPTAEEKEWLASESGRTLQQISNWFHHKRSREKSLARADIAETAVIQWMDGLKPNDPLQPTLSSPDSLTVPDSLAMEDAPKRWSQAEVVLNLLEQNKNDIARAAGNYFGTQPDPEPTHPIDEPPNDKRDSTFSKRHSSTTKRDSTMTTTTFAPSVFSRSSTYTEYTHLTTPSDVLVGEGPVKKRFRDSRDSSMFSKAAPSARSSIISHPAIPFRTRSLRFDQSKDGTPETPKTPGRGDLPRKETSDEEPKLDDTPPQTISQTDPDDVFSFEPPLPTNKSSYVAAMAKRFDAAHIEQTNSGKGADRIEGKRKSDDLVMSVQTEPSSARSSRLFLDLNIEPPTDTHLNTSHKTQYEQASSPQGNFTSTGYSKRTGTPSIKSSISTASNVVRSTGPPVVPQRTSSVRGWSTRSITSETSTSMRPSSALASRSGKTKESSLVFRQNDGAIPKKSGKVSFSEVTISQEPPYPIPPRTRPTVNTKFATESFITNRSLDIPESETSVSIDESDYDDASSGITDYSDETVKNAPRNDGLGPVLQLVLANIRRDVVARVIKELHGQQEHGQGSKSSGSYSGSQRGGSADAGTPNSQPSGIGNKRPSRDRDSNTPDERDDGDGDKRRKVTHHPISASLLRSRFACPFYKHNSEHHQRWRSCRGPGWDEVRRVKEHVYRRHVLPIRCMRCLEIFKDEVTLGAHAQQDVPCQKSSSVPENVTEGCDKDQEKRLKCRKRKPGETEEDRWADMYRVLFGEEAEVPTPYYDLDIQTASPNSNNLPIIEDHLRQLPQRLAVDINRLLNRPLDEEQRAALPAIIRSSLQEVMQPFLHIIFPSPNVSQPHSAAPSSDPGDSAYGSVDHDIRGAFTPPNHDMGSRTVLGTVPEGMQTVHRNSIYDIPSENAVPAIMLDGRMLHSSNAQIAPTTQAWDTTPYAADSMQPNLSAYEGIGSTISDISTGLYMSAPPAMRTNETTMPPPDDFSHLLYPEQSFLPDPPRPAVLPSNRWSMPLDPQASQNLTPIWDQQFPYPIETQSIPTHYDLAFTQPPNMSLPLVPQFSASQQDLTQTFPSWMLTEEGRNFIPTSTSSGTGLPQQRVN